MSHSRLIMQALSISSCVMMLTSNLALANEEKEEATTEKSSTYVEVITVQGEKRNRSMQETTSSVAVTTAQRIEQENLVGLSDVLSRTVNVSQMYGERGYTIRGISDESSSANPLATIYVDGAAIPGQINDAAPTDLWDIAQVEILRGPQSTVQGENSLAGAIILRTQDPTMDWSGKIRGQWSDPNDRRLAFAGGGPLLDDQLAFRLAVEKRDFDGFIYNPTLDTQEDPVDSLVSRFKLLWTPDFLPGLTARLSLMRDDREGPYMFNYARIDVDDFYDNRINTSNRPNTSDVTTDVQTLEVDYVFNQNWSLSSVSSKTDSDALRFFDIDVTAEDISYGMFDEAFSNRSQEFRLQFDYPAVSGLVGAYWSSREIDSYADRMATLPTPVNTIVTVLEGSGVDSDTANQFANQYAEALPQIPVAYLSDGPSKSTNRSVFADIEYRLLDDVALLAGFRYDNEEYTFQSTTSADFSGVLPDPGDYGAEDSASYRLITGINNAVLDMVARAGSETPASTRDFNAFLPKLGIRWDYAEDDSLAFTVQRAYRSGGSAFNLARGEVFAYEPEYTTNYEFAWRSRLANNLFISSNLYYVDWTDKQVNAQFGLNTYDSHTVNAGRAHLYGIELETRQYLNNYIDWYASYAYSRTQFDEFEVVDGATINDHAGREFIFAPKHTAALGMNLYWGQNWTANVNANYRSAALMSTGSDNKADARTVVNSKLSYETLDWSVYLFANNVFDKTYIEYRRMDIPYAVLGAPRVVGIGMQYQF
ncbi:TonB-dependent receptor [Aliidiomarina minuta]|uniref:TonB-dependent receptor n=1 Tax=Aliidiomarina minuta TaxID=880057 RepID=A0A432W5D4_9GAMM|nr:TonB-dependent receptor [Aliidiomarina minuta]RUO25251.1 TonB-dependent receptor [Aliidiomarina minuta]